MKQFLTLNDLSNFDAQVQLAKDIKANPYQFEHVGKRKTLGLLFFNPSLRTRLSTQKAGRLLGMDVMVMNFSNEAWAIEYEDETIMEGLRSEHVKEAAQVVSQYCDVVGIRAFAGITELYQICNGSHFEYGKCHSTSIASPGRCIDLNRVVTTQKTKGGTDLGTTPKSITTRGWKFICPNDGAYRCRFCYC
jgi:hypothetical protein